MHTFVSHVLMSLSSSGNTQFAFSCLPGCVCIMADDFQDELHSASAECVKAVENAAKSIWLTVLDHTGGGSGVIMWVVVFSLTLSQIFPAAASMMWISLRWSASKNTDMRRGRQRVAFAEPFSRASSWIRSFMHLCWSVWNEIRCSRVG